VLFEQKKVLITVKAYPNPSRKYVETVCCAGIDLNTNQWLRLYPIPFRLLKDNKRFKKYSIIEVECHRAIDDKRPESYKVNADSINVLEVIGTKDKWQQRKDIVMPTLQETMCQVCKLGIKKEKSLALIKPHDIDFEWQKAKPIEKEKQEGYKQLLFTHEKIEPIEYIPHDFYYIFKCREQSCSGHRLQIIDWEIKQAFRQWRLRYKTEALLLEKIKEKWLTVMCLKNTDPYFFVGNMHRFPKNFMVLGTFYPPISK